LEELLGGTCSQEGEEHEPRRSARSSSRAGAGEQEGKAQCPATAKDRETMSNVPYALAIGSIMYAMLCTRSDVSNALSLMSRYQCDPGVEHWITVKNILKYLNRTKEIFLVYGGDEEFVVKGYIDASFDTDSNDSKSQLGYDCIVDGDLKICKVHTDVNVADPLTKPLPRAKHDQHLNAMGVRLLPDVN
jgi:hypothetical protein